MPSVEAVWGEFSTYQKVAYLTAQNILFFPPVVCGQFSVFAPQEDIMSIWASMHLLLANAVMALHLLVLDVLRTACHSQAKVWKNIIIWDITASVKQELMVALLLVATPIK